MEKFRSEGHKIGKKYPFCFLNYLVTSKKKWEIFSNFFAFSEYRNFSSTKQFIQYTYFYTVLFPSLLCRALLCTKSQFETGDCTHFDLFQLYSQVCIFPSRNRTVRVCEAVHALAHVRTPEAHQPSKHAVQCRPVGAGGTGGTMPPPSDFDRSVTVRSPVLIRLVQKHMQAFLD